MRRSRWLCAGLLIAAASPDVPAAGATPPHRHVVALASGIGARPTGSEADRRAVEYVHRALEEAGLAVELQPVDAAIESDGERRVGSWNVLGRLAGDGAGTLVVAAHHDSRGASVPGANDDASGVAVLIETARRVALRPRRLSYLFASFCAEEEGLLGSRHYTRLADLSGVRAMIALELVGRGELLVGPVPVPPPLWAQAALLRAARRAGERGVVARPLWTLAPRFLDLPYSADHEPFLDRGVPAFLMAGTYPAWAYHTPADTADLVGPRALDRAVAVLDRLLVDLESAAPRPSPDAHYLPLMLFGQGLLIPSPALRGFALVVLGWTAGLALLNLRSLLSPARVLVAIRVLIVASAATIAGVCGLFVGEALLERVHGVRYPWMAHQRLHLALGAAGALTTGWLGLKLFRRIKPTSEPGPYGAAALLLPAAGTAAALGRGWPELAFFAAVPLAAFLASRATARVGPRIVLGLAGLAPLGLLLTPGDYRTLIDLGGVEPPGTLLFAAACVAALPFVLHLAHAAAHRDCLHSRVWWWLARGRIGAAAALLWAGLLGTAAFLPPYDAAHRQVVRVRQTVDLDGRSAAARLESSDALRGVTLGGGTEAPAGRSWDLDPPFPGEAFHLEAVAARAGPDPRLVECSVRLRTGIPAGRVAYTFTSRAGIEVPGRDGTARHGYTFTVLTPRADAGEVFRLLLPAGGDLELAVRAEIDADVLGLNPSGEARVFVHGAVVTARRPLLPPRGRRIG